MKFSMALEALARNHVVRRLGCGGGMKLHEMYVPVHISDVNGMNEHWRLCSVVIDMDDEKRRPYAFTKEHIDATDWEIVI